MKAIILAIALVTSSVSVSDKEAFQLLHEQVGVQVYNMFCGGDRYHIPTLANKLVSDEQRKKYQETGAFDISLDHWLTYVANRECQRLSKLWVERGII